MTTEAWEAQNLAFSDLFLFAFLIALLFALAAMAIVLIAQIEERIVKAGLAVSAAVLLFSAAFVARAGHPARITEYEVTHQTLPVTSIRKDSESRYATVEGSSTRVVLPPTGEVIEQIDELEVYCLNSGVCVGTPAGADLATAIEYAVSLETGKSTPSITVNKKDN